MMLTLGKHMRGVVALAATAVLSLSACSAGSGSPEASDDNPYGLREAGQLAVVINTDARPFTFVGGDGPDGFDLGLLDYAAENLGLEVTYTGQEFSAMLPAIAQGTYDVGAAGISITEERSQTVDFTEGYFLARYALLGTEGQGITDESGLAGMRVAVLQGSWMDNFATEHFTESELVRFTDNTLALMAIKNRTTDVMFVDAPIAADFVEANPDTALEIQFEITAEDAPFGFAVGKGNQALVDALDEQINAAIADGTYQALYEQYFPGLEMPEGVAPQG